MKTRNLGEDQRQLSLNSKYQQTTSNKKTESENMTMRLARCFLKDFKVNTLQSVRHFSHPANFESSNKNFPSFTTIGSTPTNFKDFTDGPNIRVKAQIALYGKPHSGSILFTMPYTLEGSLQAIDFVTNTMASQNDLASSGFLDDVLTKNCLNKACGPCAAYTKWLQIVNKQLSFSKNLHTQLLFQKFKQTAIIFSKAVLNK